LSLRGLVARTLLGDLLESLSDGVADLGDFLFHVLSRAIDATRQIVDRRPFACFSFLILR